jgi:hypothetical protein
MRTSTPVGDVIEDVVFNQGLHFSFPGIHPAGCHDCYGIFSIKPADLFALDIINRKDTPVELIRMLFLLDGPDDL